MSRFSVAAVLAALAADGIPAVQGGPHRAMFPGIADAAIIDASRVSRECVDPEDDITATFTHEVPETLSRCATGAHTWA